MLINCKCVYSIIIDRRNYQTVEKFLREMQQQIYWKMNIDRGHDSICNNNNDNFYLRTCADMMLSPLTVMITNLRMLH